MFYREMGDTGEKVSILGFGCMRLPTLGSYDRIDYEKATILLNHAIENGVNYIDTAYSYHSINNSEGGESEVFLGNYLTKNNLHDLVYLATKLPTWLLQEREDMDMFLDGQLKRLKTDQIDFYFLHSVKEKNWFHVEDLGVYEFLDSAVSDGRIKYTGFSTHDNTQFFKELVDSYQWDVCQLQYNYLDENIQVGRKGLEYAAEKGLGSVIMEPLKGGALVNQIPPEVQRIWDDFERKPAEWALRFLWNLPEVNVVLSGMNTMEQLAENLKTADEGLPNSMSAFEKEIIEKVKIAYQDKIQVECSVCGYCMPCPSGINIPQCFSYLNQAAMLKDISNVQAQYYFMLKEEEHASNCLECGLCEEICPQKISIRERLKEVKKTFGD
jgi:uncharacterized protein